MVHRDGAHERHDQDGNHVKQHGSLFYPDTRAFFDGFLGPYIPGSDASPIWSPEFFGNCIVVNGRNWPILLKNTRFRGSARDSERRVGSSFETSILPPNPRSFVDRRGVHVKTAYQGQLPTSSYAVGYTISGEEALNPAAPAPMLLTDILYCCKLTEGVEKPSAHLAAPERDVQSTVEGVFLLGDRRPTSWPATSTSIPARGSFPSIWLGSCCRAPSSMR